MFTAAFLMGCAHSGPGVAAAPAVGRDGAYSRSGARNAGATVVPARSTSVVASPAEPIDVSGRWGDGDDGGEESGYDDAGDEPVEVPGGDGDGDGD